LPQNCDAFRQLNTRLGCVAAQESALRAAPACETVVGRRGAAAATAIPQNPSLLPDAVLDGFAAAQEALMKFEAHQVRRVDPYDSTLQKQTSGSRAPPRGASGGPVGALPNTARGAVSARGQRFGGSSVDAAVITQAKF
jgi:hypothetical protein